MAKPTPLIIEAGTRKSSRVPVEPGPVRKNPSQNKSGPVFADTPPYFFVGVPAKTSGGVGFDAICSLILSELIRVGFYP
jgi:hypothetical protein